jgi:hypothetical protein
MVSYWDFFSPPNSTDRYVRIWYAEISAPTFIWVANRNKPLTISEDGNLVVIDGEKKVLWSSSLTDSVVNSSARPASTKRIKRLK